MFCPVGSCPGIKCHPLLLYVSIIVIISVTAYLNVSSFKFGYHSNDLGGVGQAAVSDVVGDFNPVVCNTYNVTSSNPMNVFLVKGTATIERGNISTLTRQAADLFPGIFVNRNSFYLLEGSKMKLTACIDSGSKDKNVQIIVLKGTNSWNAWTLGGCNGCSLRVIPLRTECKDGNLIFQYNVVSRDTYFVTITKDNDHSVTSLDVTAELEVNRTTFDTSHAQQVCLSATKCVLDLTAGNSEDVIIESDDLLSFGTECGQRLVFWFGVFAVLPLGLVIVGVLVFLSCRKKKEPAKNTRGGNSAFDDTTKLVQEDPPFGYNSVIKTANVQIS
ncbi:uncharacterized protein [Haliotis cracherodii]|uniref:uncharacterized protein n=1 Tax=Haliotis cracherodii TaxID=6455 RepID=UPI0039EAA9EB